MDQRIFYIGFIYLAFQVGRAYEQIQQEKELTQTVVEKQADAGVAEGHK